MYSTKIVRRITHLLQEILDIQDFTVSTSALLNLVEGTGNGHVVNLDDVWESMGYSRQRVLTKHFKAGPEFTVSTSALLNCEQGTENGHKPIDKPE